MVGSPRGSKRQPHAVVVGGGVAGLTSALALSRRGHTVTILERDDLPAVADPDAAFRAARRGAPQVHQTHAFLARIVVELREHLPDVLSALSDAGGYTMATTVNLGDPQPGDADLAVLVVRRTTFEWVLRRATLAEGGVTIRTRTAVTGLQTVPELPGRPATVTGVSLEDGSAVEADFVVAAMGRRSPVPEWLARHGVVVPETVHESGLMYLTRWYRLPPGTKERLDPKLGGNLEFVKYLGVPGDGDSLSITLAIRPDDAELRSALVDPARFEAACRLLPGPDQFFRDGPLEPVGGVRPMAGLLNRIRRFSDPAGAPLLLGFHAVGDAHTCTNPLYGRGCTLAVIQALRLAAAAADHPDDPAGRASAYEAASGREVAPSFDFAVMMDRMGADPAGTGGIGGTGAAGTAGDAGKVMAAVLTASATDPVIGRGLLRYWNLVASNEELMTDTTFVSRVAEVMADPDAYPVPERQGPNRHELLAALADTPDAGRPTGVGT